MSARCIVVFAVFLGALPLCMLAATPGLTVEFTPSFASQYMYRGVRRGGASFQPYIQVSRDNWVGGLWASVPLKDKVPGQSDPELDPYGSCTFELAQGLTLEPGFIFYTYPRADEKNGFYKVTFEPSFALNYIVKGIKVTPKIYHDLMLAQTLLEFSAACALPLKELGTELDFVGTIGTFRAAAAMEDATPDVKNWGNYWLVGVTLPFQIKLDRRLSVGWTYAQGSDNFRKQSTLPKVATAAAIGRGVITFSYTFFF